MTPHDDHAKPPHDLAEMMALDDEVEEGARLQARFDETFHDRLERIERFAEAAADFVEHATVAVAVDWRGVALAAYADVRWLLSALTQSRNSEAKTQKDLAKARLATQALQQQANVWKKKRLRLERERSELREGDLTSALADQRVLYQNVIVSLRDSGALTVDLAKFDAWLEVHDADSRFGWPGAFLMRHPADRPRRL